MADERRNAIGQQPADTEEPEGATTDNEASTVHSDAMASPSDLEERIRELEAEVAKHESETKANYDRFLRERADLENFKRRAAREREETLRYGHEGLVRGLLPVLDNLERAVEHAASGGDDQPLLEGVNLVLKGFREVLEQHGIRSIASLGERFDPAVHEAMEQIESDQHEPNTVVREHQKGYLLHDRLIRPALVGVSKLPVRQSEPDEPGNGPD